MSKNNTLISGNKTNNGKNPVCEISYGTADKELSRFLFDIDLSLLKNKINNGIINSKSIVSHTLNMTNTIRFAEEYVGKKSYATSIHRASNFTLDLFQVNQEWDEGTSYDFIYGVNYLNNSIEQESNWVNRKLNTPWDYAGAYSAGTNTIIGSQYFRSGSENLNIDITSLVNNSLTANTLSNGLGIKFQDVYENTATNLREAVGFHTKYTNTVYEPYVETIIEDTIIDDRNFFFLDKENSLYLYSPDDVTINNVTIYDYEDNIYSVISGASVVNVSKGVNKISLTIDSDTYPDAVIFRDVWNVIVNGKTKNISNMFYLITQENYFNFNNQMNFDNYFFSFQGIKEREKISSNHIRKIKVLVKEMYPNQNNFIPLDIEYRIFTTVAHKYEIDFVPFTKVNRTNYSYEFNLDTSWLIPQDYKIQIRLKNGYFYENKEILNFKIVNYGINVNEYIVPTTTDYVATTTVFVPTTTIDIPTTTDYVPTTTVYEITTTEYAPTTTSPPQALELTFDDIVNAEALVGDISLIANWNTFFGFDNDTSLYTTIFSSVVIGGNKVELYGGSGITILQGYDDNTSSYINFGGNTHIIAIDDNAGCVIALGYCSFYETTNLTTAKFSAVKSMGDYCFYSSSISIIDFSSLTIVGASSFSSTGLINPDFPSLINMGDSCFSYIIGLKTINFPLQITFGCGWFAGCVNLNQDFSYLVTAGDQCFAECISLTSDFPVLTTAGIGCFQDCTFVNPNFSFLTTAGNQCFYSCTGLTSNFPALTTAGDNSYYGCTSLISPNFSSLLTAGVNCFGGCIGLVSPNFSSLITIENFCFSDCRYLLSPIFLNLTTSKYRSFYNCTSLLSPNFSSLTTSGEQCFMNCISLISDFPSLTTASDYCFNNCTNLTSDFPLLTTAGRGCFSYCTSLTSPDFSLLVSCGDYCFAYSSIINIHFPSLTSMGDDSFYNVTNIYTVNLEQLTNLGYNWFIGNHITTINLPLVTIIPDGFFQGFILINTINISSCTNLGTTVGNNNIFNSITGQTITLTVSSALMNAQGIGIPDGDIQYLIDPLQNNTVTINQV